MYGTFVYGRLQKPQNRINRILFGNIFPYTKITFATAKFKQVFFFTLRISPTEELE